MGRRKDLPLLALAKTMWEETNPRANLEPARGCERTWEAGPPSSTPKEGTQGAPPPRAIDPEEWDGDIWNNNPSPFWKVLATQAFPVIQDAQGLPQRVPWNTQAYKDLRETKEYGPGSPGCVQVLRGIIDATNPTGLDLRHLLRGVLTPVQMAMATSLIQERIEQWVASPANTQP